MNQYRVVYYNANDDNPERDLGIYMGDTPMDAIETAIAKHYPHATLEESADLMRNLSAYLRTSNESTGVNYKTNARRLRIALETLLSKVDYMHGACREIDPVAAVLTQAVITDVRKTLEDTRE